VTTVPSSLILSIKATLASCSPSVRRRALAVALTFAVGFPVLSQSSNQEAIPFRFSHAFGLILINAEVNGAPLCWSWTRARTAPWSVQGLSMSPHLTWDIEPPAKEAPAILAQVSSQRPR
jgi:hypothetical protein